MPERLFAPLFYRNVDSLGWSEDIIFENHNRFGETLELRPPEDWRLHYLSKMEEGRLTDTSSDACHDVLANVIATVPTSFHDELTVSTRGLTAVGARRHHFIIKLDESETLTEERRALMDILGLCPTKPNKPFLFNVYVGRLEVASLKNVVRFALQDYLPPTLRLLPGSGKVGVRPGLPKRIGEQATD